MLRMPITGLNRHNRLFVDYPRYKESDETPPVVLNNPNKWLDIPPDFDGLGHIKSDRRELQSIKGRLYRSRPSSIGILSI